MTIPAEQLAQIRSRIRVGEDDKVDEDKAEGLSPRKRPATSRQAAPSSRKRILTADGARGGGSTDEEPESRESRPRPSTSRAKAAGKGQQRETRG